MSDEPLTGFLVFDLNGGPLVMHAENAAGILGRGLVERLMRNRGRCFRPVQVDHDCFMPDGDPRARSRWADDGGRA